MKITVKKFGFIENAELKINDLTIIAGANNTGKTYVTYALYGFLKRWKKFAVFHETKSIVEALTEKGSGIAKISEVQKREPEIVNGIAKRYSENIPEIFSAEKGSFPDAEINVFIDDKRDSFDEKQTSKVAFGENVVVEAKLEGGNILFSLLVTDKKDIPPPFVLGKIINILLAEICLQNHFLTPFILSAERLGISLFYKELDIRRNVLVEKLQKMSHGNGKDKEVFDPFELIEEFSARFAVPIRDNISFTRNVDVLQKKQCLLKNGKALADKIKDMMGGYYRHTGVEIRFISKARKDGKFDLPLYMASSSARALSDFYFFLKHEAKEGYLVVIDEPESHLDPANQILLARLLASCVNSGLKVLITTHSDYLIKEFNNLIMLGNDFKGKDVFLSSRKNDYTKNDCLDQQRVSAYLCENRTLTPCQVDQKGMRIRSFDDTIDQINEISDELDFLTDGIKEQ